MDFLPLQKLLSSLIWLSLFRGVLVIYFSQYYLCDAQYVWYVLLWYDWELRKQVMLCYIMRVDTLHYHMQIPVRYHTLSQLSDPVVNLCAALPFAYGRLMQTITTAVWSCCRPLDSLVYCIWHNTNNHNRSGLILLCRPYIWQSNAKIMIVIIAIWSYCFFFLCILAYPIWQANQVTVIHRRTGNFLPGGGGDGKTFAQKNFASCPNFYETVEKKRGSYDALT